MKMNGLKIVPPKPMVVVLPFGDDQLVFNVDIVKEEFPVPRPEPKEKLLPGGKREKYIDDPAYIESLKNWIEAEYNWMYVKSLEATKGLEWDDIDVEKDPMSVIKFDKELLDAGLSKTYIETLKMKIIEHNGMRPDLIEEATKRFLAGQDQQ